MSTPPEGAVDVLIAGLRKAVKDDTTEWVDANIIRLLLDRYSDDPAPGVSESGTV